MNNSGKLTLFPYGRLKTKDSQLEDRLNALLVYCKSDQQRWIENTGLSLNAFLDHLRRLPHLAMFFRDSLVVITKGSPAEVLETRKSLTRAYPDLSMARWIVCHLDQDSRDLHELGIVHGDMDDLPVLEVGETRSILFTSGYRPSSATPIRLQRIEGQNSSASSQTMAAVKG